MLPARLVLPTARCSTRRRCEPPGLSQSHGGFLRAVEALRGRVRGNKSLTERILHKYSIKNVMGLNLLPLVRFDEIVRHRPSSGR